MEIVSLFIEFLSPQTLYAAGERLTIFIAVSITPVLLVIAISIRTLETSVAGLTGQHQWGRALKDIAIWSLVLMLYFGLTNLIIDLFNSLYSAFSEQGSLAKLLGDMERLFSGINDQVPEGESFDLFAFSAPAVIVTFLIYYATLVLLAFVTIFMQLAHAIGYSLVVAWGMIAIPISITANLKILKGWAVLMGVLLVWPVVHYIIFAFLDPMILNASNQLLTHDISVGLTKSALYMLFSIINLILIVAAIAAPFVAMPLINGSGSITGLVAPFVGGAMSATTTVLAGTKAAAWMGGRQGLRSVQGLGQSNGLLTQAARGLHSRLFPEGQAASFKPEPQRHSASANAATQKSATVKAPKDKNDSKNKAAQRAAQAVASSAAVNAPVDREPSSTMTSGDGDAAVKQKRQLRRGVILNQLHNKGKIQLKGRKRQ